MISHLEFEVTCYWSIMEPELTDTPFCYAPSPNNHTKIESQNMRQALKEKYRGLGKYMPRGLDVGRGKKVDSRKTDSGSKLSNLSPRSHCPFAV